MKRLINCILIIVIILGCNVIKAQTGVKIYKKDGSIIFISKEDLDLINILGEEDELRGKVEEGDVPNSIIISNNIRDLKDGDFLNATAFVTAKCLKGLILTDKGGSIFYYNPEIDLSQYPDNTVVEVKGYIREYDRGLQLTPDTKITVIGEKKYDYPSPVYFTGKMIEDVCISNNIIENKYISVRGVIIKDEDEIYLEFEGTDNLGKIFYPLKNLEDYDFINKQYFELLKQFLNTYMPDGCDFTFDGYPINYNNNKFNILIRSISFNIGANCIFSNFYRYYEKKDDIKYLPFIITVENRCAIPLKINEEERYLSSRRINKAWIGDVDDISKLNGFNSNAWNSYVAHKYEFTLSQHPSFNDENFYTVIDQYGRYMSFNPTDGKLKFTSELKLTNGAIDNSYVFSLGQNEQGNYILLNESIRDEPRILCYSVQDKYFKLMKTSEINEAYKIAELFFTHHNIIEF